MAPMERLTSGREPALGAVRVDVWARRVGRGYSGCCAASGRCARLPAFPFPWRQMLARKEILTEEGGVYAPEACLKPDIFLPAMKAKGVEPSKTWL